MRLFRRKMIEAVRRESREV